VITGASQWSRIPATNSWEGAAYVTWGGPLFGGEDLAGLRRSIRLEGRNEGGFAGTGVGRVLAAQLAARAAGHLPA
jgi:hypothetical protein